MINDCLIFPSNLLKSHQSAICSNITTPHLLDYHKRLISDFGFEHFWFWVWVIIFWILSAWLLLIGILKNPTLFLSRVCQKRILMVSQACWGVPWRIGIYYSFNPSEFSMSSSCMWFFQPLFLFWCVRTCTSMLCYLNHYLSFLDEDAFVR